MNVQVDLEYSDGDPSLSVTESDDGVRAVIDVRLSEAQVDRACATLGDVGDAVALAWRERMGLSDRQPAT